MKNLINYLFCIAVSVLLSIYISGTGGMFILFLLCLALVVSLIILFVTKRQLQADIRLDTEIADKNERLIVSLEFSKKTILPTSFIEIQLGATPNIKLAEREKFKVIAARRNGDIIEFPVIAQLCGEGEIRIEKINLLDYLGIVRLKTTICDSSDLAVKLKIMPQIHDTGVQAEVLKATAENAVTNDDEDEEESDEAALGSTGVAGYEHRKYEIGDPLKRVNWKMSSKRDILMVRLDDKVLTSTQDFLLDYPEKENADLIYYQNADLVVEASLAMLSMLLMQGYTSSYRYYLDGWKTVDVTDEKSLTFLQEELAGIKPCPMSQRSISSADSTQICFTCCTGDMVKELSVYSDNRNCSVVVTDKSGIGKITANMWQVNNEFEFVKI